MFSLPLQETKGDPDQAANWLFTNGDNLPSLLAEAAKMKDAREGAKAALAADAAVAAERGGKFELVGFVSHMGQVRLAISYTVCIQCVPVCSGVLRRHMRTYHFKKNDSHCRVSWQLTELSPFLFSSAEHGGGALRVPREG